MNYSRESEELYNQAIAIIEEDVDFERWNEAEELLQQSAAAGNGDAMYRLGLACLEDGGTDYEGAIAWYQKAVEVGQGEAMKELGLCYLSGIVVEQDVDKAVGLLENAAAMEVEGAEEILKEISA